MTRLLDTVYFGRLDRAPFFLLVGAATGLFALLFVWLIVTAQGAEPPSVILGALRRSASLFDAPAILLAHGVSEARTAGAMTLIGLYLIGALFMLAARARDIGLAGWPTAFLAMPVFLFAGAADPWIGGVAALLLAGFFLWPPRE